MINADISNIWGELSLPALLALEREVFDAHMRLTDKTGRGADYLGWMALPDRMTTTELQRIRQAAERIREQSQVLVVVGIGGSYLGARAAIELLRGQQYNLTSKTIQILFAGNSFSTRSHQELLELLSGRDFSVCIISKSGTTMEPALVTRSLKWLLEQKYGAEEAKKRIYVITGGLRGVSHSAGCGRSLLGPVRCGPAAHGSGGHRPRPGAAGRFRGPAAVGHPLL